MRLAEKVILVTGSTAGIGQAMARRFVREGAKVVLHGLEADSARQMERELGPHAAALCCNLADPESAPRLVEFAVSRFGRLDALVNNAADVSRANLETTDAGVFDRFIAVNLRAPLLLIRAAAPQLERTRGAVLNIGSVNAYCGEPNLLPYSISKGGMMTLTRNLADALGPRGIRVNQVNPGWVLTESERQRKIEDGLPEDWPSRVPAHLVPFGRLMTPEDIAGAAVFYVSDESRMFTGIVAELNQYPMIGRNPPKSL